MKFLDSITIALRLIIGFSLLAFLLLVTGGLNYLRMTQMQADTQAIKETAPLVDSAMEMGIAVLQHQLAIMEIMDGASKKEVDGYWSVNAVAKKQFSVYYNAILKGGDTKIGRVYPAIDPDLRSIVESLGKQQADELQPRINKIYKLTLNSLRNDGQLSGDEKDLEEIYSKLITDIDTTKSELSAIAEKITSAQFAYAKDYGHTKRWPEMVDNLYIQLLDIGKQTASIGLVEDASSMSVLASTHQVRVQRITTILTALLNGTYIDGETLPAIDYPELNQKIEKWKSVFETLYLPKIAEYKGLLTKRLAIDQDKQELDKQADELAYKMRQSLVTVQQKGRQILKATSENSDATADMAISTSIVLVVVGLIAAAVLAFFTILSITKPLERVVARLRDIAEGEGDLTLRLNADTKNELGRLSHWFNTFVDRVQSVVAQVHEVSQQLSVTAEKTAVITEETNSGVNEQNIATEQVATAMDELAATVHDVARNTSEAATATDAASEETEKGAKVVTSTVDRINELAAEVGDSADIIQKLAEDSENVAGVLDVIRGIAEQTNLLALNAAIEAARAGEQGRGFAVVADEVRTLAGRTQQSTHEIQEMTERLQSGASSAVEAMERGKAKAQQGVEDVAKAGDSLTSITASVNSIKDINMQVASAAEEQSAVAEEIKRNVSSISGNAEGTTAGAQKTLQASEQMSELSSKLQSLVGGFKV